MKRRKRLSIRRRFGHAAERAAVQRERAERRRGSNTAKRAGRPRRVKFGYGAKRANVSFGLFAALSSVIFGAGKGGRR